MPVINFSEEKELQYFPNNWSKRYKPDEAFPKHVEFLTKACNEAKETIPCKLNVSYGSNDDEKLDIYGTHLSKNSPIFIFLHGGFWRKMHRNKSNFMAKTLVQLGIKVVVVGYTLCPYTTIDKIVVQTEVAVKKCLHSAHKNNSKGVYLCGHSAGAHLVVSLFQSFVDLLPSHHQSLLKKVVLISGLYDLIPLIETTLNESLKLDVISAKEVSPLFQPLRVLKVVDIYVVVGEEESPAFKKQSTLFHERLASLGFSAKFAVVKGVDHFSIVERLCDEEYELTRLIAEDSYNYP